MTQRETIHDRLAQARVKLQRLTAEKAYSAMQQGAVLIDTRQDDHLRAQGAIPGARHHPLSVLEWRVDPTAPMHDPTMQLGDRIILICAEGYSSSLAATRLQAIGFDDATDVIDGFVGWREAGLPIVRHAPHVVAVSSGA